MLCFSTTRYGQTEAKETHGKAKKRQEFDGDSFEKAERPTRWVCWVSFRLCGVFERDLSSFLGQSGRCHLTDGLDAVMTGVKVCGASHGEGEGSCAHDTA